MPIHDDRNPPTRGIQPEMTLDQLRQIDFAIETYNRSLQSTYQIREDLADNEHENHQLHHAIIGSASILHETLIRVHDSIVQEIRKTQRDN